MKSSITWISNQCCCCGVGGFSRIIVTKQNHFKTTSIIKRRRLPIVRQQSSSLQSLLPIHTTATIYSVHQSIPIYYTSSSSSHDGSSSNSRGHRRMMATSKHNGNNDGDDTNDAVPSVVISTAATENRVEEELEDHQPPPLPQQQQHQQDDDDDDDDKVVNDEKDDVITHSSITKTDDTPISIIRTPLLPPLPHQIAKQYNHVPMPPSNDYKTYNPQYLAQRGQILQHLQIIHDQNQEDEMNMNESLNNNNNDDDDVGESIDKEATTSISSSSSSSPTTTTTKSKITTNTSSGKNSYLKINLFQRPYLEGLYNITASIQQRLDTALQEHIDNGNRPKLQQLPNIYYSKRFRKTRTFKLQHTIPNTNFQIKPETINEIKRKEKVIVPPLQIIPRSLSSLHCTLFFGGTTLYNEFSNDELVYFYEKITKRMAKSGFICDTETNPKLLNSYSHLPDDYWFHVKEFKVFPPRGKYLIIAELQASLAYHHLYNDIQNTARNEMAKWNNIDNPSDDDDDNNNNSATTKSAIHAFMNLPAQKHIPPRWVPHITVANIQHAMDGKRVEEKILQKVLKQLSTDHHHFDTMNNDYTEHIENMKCHSISMGGPIPQLKKEYDDNDSNDDNNHNNETLLDWDYQFQFERRGAKQDLEWDDSIWEQRYEPDPMIRKKYLKRKNRLIARGLLPDPNDEVEQQRMNEDSRGDNNDDDDDDIEDGILGAHPQKDILKVFRNQPKIETNADKYRITNNVKE